MTDPREDKPPTTGGEPDELDLDKQTIQDLDLTEPDADAVVGGGAHTTGGGGDTTTR